MRSLLSRRLVPLLSLLALAVACWYTPQVWAVLDRWVEDQRTVFWGRLETALGQKVVYDRIAPNVLAALDFQNVRILADDGTNLFQAASVRVSWDWERLFQGRFTEALRRVQVINALVSVDSRRDQALVDRISGFFQPSRSEGQTAFDFQIEGFNVTARWTDGQQSVSLDRIFAVLSPQGREWGLKFRGAAAWQDRSPIPSFARFSVRGELRSDASFRNWNSRSEFLAIRTTWFDIDSIGLQVAVDPEQVTVTKVSFRTPFDLQAVWNRKDDQWTFSGAAEGFRPSQLVRLKGQQVWAGVADGLFTGQFLYRLGGDFSFSGEASWAAGALPAPLADKPLAVEGTVGTRGGALLFQGFHLEREDIAFVFNGDLSMSSFFPEGTLLLERFTGPGVENASGTVHLNRNGSVIVFTGEDWIWNGLGTQSPSGWVERSTDHWKFAFQGPLDGTASAQLMAQGAFFPGPVRVEAAVAVDTLPLSSIQAEALGFFPQLNLPSELWALETSFHAWVLWDPESGPEFTATDLSFRDPLVPERFGSGSGSWRGSHLEVVLDQGSWDAFQGAGLASVDFEEGGAVGGRVAGTVRDRSFDLQVRWVPLDRTLALSGKPGISAIVHQSADGVWTAQVSLEPQVVVPGWTVGFQGKATLDGSFWTIEADRVTVVGRLPWNNEAFSARGKVRADSGFIRVDDLVVNDSIGAWTGACVTSWSPDFSSPWAGRLTLATPTSARETLILDWVGTATDQWHASVRASGIDLGRLPVALPTGLSGRLGVVGSGEWKGIDATWSLQTALSEARWGDSPVGFRTFLSGTTRRLSVRNLNLSLAPVRIIDGSADLDVDSRTWKTSLNAGLRVGAGDWESRLQASGGWTPEGVPLRVSGMLSSSANQWSQRTFDDWSLSGSWGAAAWDFAMGNGGLSVQGGAEGSFMLRAQSPFPVQGVAQGSWSGSAFNLSVQDFRADLALVKEFVSSKLLSLTSGRVEGDFVVGGNLADPEFNGSLLLKDVVATSSFVRQSLGPVDIPVVLEGHRLRVDPVDIGPGTQIWLVSGAARIDHLLPEEYQFTVQTDAFSVIPVSYQYTGISAQGAVNGLLVVKGSPLAVTLGGRLALQDTVITLKSSSTTEVSTGEPLGFNADLTLVTGRKVEFLWPNETLPLLRAVTASGQTLQVKANDVASTWSVTGKVGLRTGEINYLNRTFILREGLLTFQEDQTGFDPKMSVRAEWRYRDDAGPVMINLRADGTLTRFSPQFDASPYKSPDELQRLVGTTLALPTDYTARPAAGLEAVGNALSVASDVGTSFLLTPFEETVKANFGLDLFTVKTEILKKSLLKGNERLDASNYLDNTRLFFGKYIGDDLFLQGTLAFRQDTSVAAQVSPKMVIEPELQMEFQTPFFLLNWTLLPQHPETLFVTDNTVTFRWNWSY